MLQMSKSDGSKGKSLLDRCSVRLDKVKAKLWHKQSLTPDARAISGRLEDLPSPKQVFGNPSGLLQSGKLAAHPEDLPEAFGEDTVVPHEAQVELQGPTNDGGESLCVQFNVIVTAQPLLLTPGIARHGASGCPGSCVNTSATSVAAESRHPCCPRLCAAGANLGLEDASIAFLLSGSALPWCVADCYRATCLSAIAALRSGRPGQGGY